MSANVNQAYARQIARLMVHNWSISQISGANQEFARLESVIKMMSSLIFNLNLKLGS